MKIRLNVQFDPFWSFDLAPPVHMNVFCIMILGERINEAASPSNRCLDNESMKLYQSWSVSFYFDPYVSTQ
jgi:hypothetical protein